MSSRPSSPSNRFNLTIAALSSILTVFSTFALQGCGQETPVFDQALKHTPETLVAEFVARYKNLPPNRKPLKEAAKPKGEIAEQDEAAKSSRKEAVVKGEMIKESETLENVVSTLEERLGKVEGLSRDVAAKKAADLISKETAIKPDDKAAVIERLEKLD